MRNKQLVIAALAALLLGGAAAPAAAGRSCAWLQRSGLGQPLQVRR